MSFLLSVFLVRIFVGNFNDPDFVVFTVDTVPRFLEFKFFKADAFFAAGAVTFGAFGRGEIESAFFAVLM